MWATYSFFAVGTEFHVDRMHTKFLPSFPHHIKVSAGLVEDKQSSVQCCQSHAWHKREGT